MVGADKSTELWRHPSLCIFDHTFGLPQFKNLESSVGQLIVGCIDV